MTTPGTPPPAEPPEPAAPAEPPGAATAGRARPPSNAGWAVASLLFFWPLAFAAFTHAFNVYPLWADGDVEGAAEASDRVRRLGQISLWLFGGLLLLFVLVYAVVAVSVFAHGGGYHGYMHHRMR
ncbi:CD225/dispanin family protein [Rhodococcus sp. NPDC127528]|uniref:CD225/dispanin family protein n=1 Tax=unclassified Rhodococcus (in: high G+C Gram-positive bacteria) TaxID=192944 RepID=UPI003634B2D2